MLENLGVFVQYSYYLAVIAFVLKEFGVLDRFTAKSVAATSNQTATTTRSAAETTDAPPAPDMGSIFESLGPMIAGVMSQMQPPQEGDQPPIKDVGSSEAELDAELE